MNQSVSMLLQALFEKENTQSRTAIDIGAHKGLFVQSLVETGWFDKILAFEPNPSVYAILQDRLSAQSEANCEPVNLALGAKQGSFSFFSDANSATASLLPYHTSYQATGDIRETEVPVETLDGFLSGRPDIHNLRFLKIDTQGNDLSVLRGAQAIIAAHRPVVQVELIFIPLYEGQCSPEEVKDEFSKLGYHLHSLGDIHITGVGKLAFCDGIFVSNDCVIPTSQEYHCIDNEASYKSQIAVLNQICAERLDVIERLSEEIRLQRPKDSSLLGMIASWIR